MQAPKKSDMLVRRRLLSDIPPAHSRCKALQKEAPVPSSGSQPAEQPSQATRAHNSSARPSQFTANFLVQTSGRPMTYHRLIINRRCLECGELGCQASAHGCGGGTMARWSQDTATYLCIYQGTSKKLCPCMLGYEERKDLEPNPISASLALIKK